MQQGQRSLRVPRNTARALAARGPPPGRGSAALLGSQQQDVLYACPLNSMCQCAGMPNETSTLIEINCNEVALYKFPGETERGAGWGMGRRGSWTWKWKWKVAAADAVKPLHILVSDGTGRQATQRGCQYFLWVGEGQEKVAEAAQAGGRGAHLSRFIYVANIFVRLRYKLPQPQLKQRQFQLPLATVKLGPCTPLCPALPLSLSVSISAAVSVACCRLKRNVIF